ncbi:MAG: mRNA surveillance protein pelota [Candidatus Bathyarchaeia archaeon]
MNILKFDHKLGIITLVPRSVEDLWDLYNVIESEDLVSGPTTRIIKTPDADNGDKVRIPTHLTIRVKTTELDLISETLKLSGIVVESPEELEGVRGHHHSLAVKLGTKIMIKKDEWLKHQLQRLMSKRRRSKPLLIVAIESGESAIGIIRDFGIVSIQQVSRHIPGKIDSQYREQALKQFFQEILEIIRQSINQPDYSIVIVGPGFVKNDLADFLRSTDQRIARKIVYLGSATSGTQAGIYEALRSGAIEKTRAIEESILVEEVLARIGSGRNVAYGFQDVRKAAEFGSIETLLISEKLPISLNSEERGRLEDLIRLVEKGKGRISIISSRHEGGEKLERLGGICALLRYPVQLR